MLWFYVSSLAVLIGAELNAEIEHSSPYGKDPGEKAPGDKKKIGALAEHAYENRKAAGALNPAIARTNCDVDVDLPPASPAVPRLPRARDWVVSALVVGEAALVAYLKLRSRFSHIRS